MKTPTNPKKLSRGRKVKFNVEEGKKLFMKNPKSNPGRKRVVRGKLTIEQEKALANFSGSVDGFREGYEQGRKDAKRELLDIVRPNEVLISIRYRYHNGEPLGDRIDSYRRVLLPEEIMRSRGELLLENLRDFGEHFLAESEGLKRFSTPSKKVKPAK